MSSRRDRLAKEYATDEIVVEWEPRLCFHSRNCVRSLPRVFDESRRPSPADAEIVDVPEAGRYELRLGGRLVGLAAYRRRDGRIAFTHTEVDEACEGRGFGSRLAEAALDDARRQGLDVVPLCPFIAHFIEGHPEYEPLVASGQRVR